MRWHKTKKHLTKNSFHSTHFLSTPFLPQAKEKTIYSVTYQKGAGKCCHLKPKCVRVWGESGLSRGEIGKDDKWSSSQRTKSKGICQYHKNFSLLHPLNLEGGFLRCQAKNPQYFTNIWRMNASEEYSRHVPVAEVLTVGNQTLSGYIFPLNPPWVMPWRSLSLHWWHKEPTETKLNPHRSEAILVAKDFGCQREWIVPAVTLHFMEEFDKIIFFWGWFLHCFDHMAH